MGFLSNQAIKNIEEALKIRTKLFPSNHKLVLGEFGLNSSLGITRELLILICIVLDAQTQLAGLNKKSIPAAPMAVESQGYYL